MKKSFPVLSLLAGFVVGSTIVSAAVSSDQSFQIVQTCEPRVNKVVGELLPTTGVVRVVVNIDEQGKLTDWLLIESAHPRLTSAAVEALTKWTYRPAVIGGESFGVRTELIFNFDIQGQVVSMSCLDTIEVMLQGMVNPHKSKLVYRGGELDSVPKTIVTVSPRPVAQVAGSTQKGVLVDFYIDETGRPRMVTVDSGGNPEMGASALEAIQQWTFTVPTYKGKPVAVRATQWFDFSKAVVATQ
ncbi:MAG: TonB family protein [Verrucomicrobia bacterium]|nr:TonB family protein [Verrucomicrobiota bacterium]